MCSFHLLFVGAFPLLKFLEGGFNLNLLHEQLQRAGNGGRLTGPNIPLPGFTDKLLQYLSDTGRRG